MPRIADGASRVVVDAASLMMLLDGVDLRAVRRIPTWQPAKAGIRSQEIDIRRRA